jgi:ATP-dependent Clp protease ATP-binding subunit ClpA
MFERFTDRARRVVVLAQEEARDLGHDYIGTEHILLGLIRVSDGVAAQALESLGISLAAVRREVIQIVGQGDMSQLPSHIPFTRRAKKVLELSLREALQLGHNYIGTEHILLGLLREGEGVGAQVLVKLGADLNRVRQQVIQVLQLHPVEEEAGVVEIPGEVPAPGARLRSSTAAHVGPPVRVVGSRIQLESLNVRIGEVISRLDVIVERLASMEERVASIESRLAEGLRPPARAPRKPSAAKKPKPPAAGPPAGEEPQPS